MNRPVTKYPKHFLIIRDQVFDIGNDINIDEDMDNVFSVGSFTLPHFSTNTWTTKNLRKYDRVQIYYGEFLTANERNLATVDRCKKIFDGYIDSTPLSESKTEGIQWNGIGIKSSLALIYERTMTTPIYSGNLKTILIRALTETSLLDYIDYFEIDTNITDNLVLNIQGDKYVGKVLDQIKEKYAIQIFQKPDSGLRFQFPSSFNLLGQTLNKYFSNGNVTQVTDQENAWVYDLNSNVFNIDYGDLTQRVDTVIVYGLNTTGVAFDPIAYQLKQGVSVDDLQENITPVKENLNAFQIFRRDIQDEESCQRIASEKLIEFAKNYGITLNVMFNVDEKVGDRFIVTNSEKISPTQLWTIKSRKVSISKEGAVKCSIVGYSNSVKDIPSGVLLGSSGILDTDILNITDRIPSTTELQR